MKISILRKLTLLAVAIGISGSIYGFCSFEIDNKLPISFAKLKARGEIQNLFIPLCTQEVSRDKDVLAACHANPRNVLFTIPTENMDKTCAATNMWPVMVQFDGSEVYCVSEPQDTQDREIKLRFPQDFNCFPNLSAFEKLAAGK